MKIITINNKEYTITDSNLESLILSGAIKEAVKRRAGQYYKIDETIYLLSLIDPNENIVLVSTRNGNRLTVDPVKVMDSLNISQTEWQLICNNRPERFHLSPIKVEIKES